MLDDNADFEATGYFLPEASQFRLVRLGEHIRFLARLSRPRSADEECEIAAIARAGELSACMELLAEQVEIVLRELSWPAQRHPPYQARGLGADSGVP
ncbi:hypothetical protein QE400_003616 [Xanthomonas sacchari]|uniref:XAC0095 family protein n=1 Tax=Xanthomonas sacchari TaxID=56458 RepID=UPI002784640E|nr:hypothetical protein [Xanthomonas sacchari]MDQ1094203.1 hypothetical protein [Xanthomonas sacchari]